MFTTIGVVKEITGIRLSETQDPYFNHRRLENSIHFSISELDKDFTIETGEQRFSKDNPTYVADGDYQIHRVVEYPGQGVLEYRLCKAMEGSEYEAYIVANLELTTPENHKEVLAYRMESAEMLTRDRT
jgi:hypothetical protein